MHKAVALVSLLVLGWSGSLQGLPVIPEPIYTTQEGFDNEQFLGTWYEVAMVTTNPILYLAHKGTPMSKLVVQDNQGNLTATQTAVRRGVCTELVVEFENTPTPGRYLFNVSQLQMRFDAYVVQCNCSEYAIMIMSSTGVTGNKSTSLKLFSRSGTIQDAMMDDYKTLVKEQGIGEDKIITKPDQGDCVPGDMFVPPPVVKRGKRDVSSALNLGAEEGSGMDDSFFNATEACAAPVDIGPCYALIPRYFYNATANSCQSFNYGGCAGNQNNFETERDCLQRCRTEAACRLPMAPQPCTGEPPNWVFDSSLGLCVPYKKDFCQNNANKFYSKAECLEFCGVGKDDEAELIED